MSRTQFLSILRECSGAPRSKMRISFLYYIGSFAVWRGVEYGLVHAVSSCTGGVRRQFENCGYRRQYSKSAYAPLCRRCIKGLENVNRPIYGSSQPRHTLVLERIPATSAPTVQTAKRCHVWLFGRLEPLVETLSVVSWGKVAQSSLLSRFSSRFSDNLRKASAPIVRLRAVRAHAVMMGPDMHCCRSSWPIRNAPASLLHSRSLPMRTKLGDQQYLNHLGSPATAGRLDVPCQQHYRRFGIHR